MPQPPSMSGHRSNSGAPLAAVMVRRAAVVTALLGTLLGSASAGTEVRGTPDAVYLRAENATVGEVLAALSAKFQLKIQPHHPRPGDPISGVYTGSLRHVLMRVLDGSSYVLTYAGDGVQVKLLGNAKSEAGQPALAAAVRDVAVAPTAVAPTVVVPFHATAPPLVPADVPRLVPK
jgi:hypothetical protein